MRTFLLALKLLAASAALSLLAACGGGSSGGPAGAGSGFASLSLETALWGRLVDVFDESGVLVEEDVVVRQSLQSDGLDYTLSLNPVTQREVLTIVRPYLDDNGRVTPEFETLFEAAQEGLASLGNKGWVANGAYTRVGRNGALKLQFSEFLDPSTVNRLTLQVVVNGSIADVRYIVKEGADSRGRAKGIVIIDSTITPQDSADLAIGENGIGFEASSDGVSPNAAIRIPTEVEPLYGQTQVLRNRAGNRGLGVTASDPTELSGGLSQVVLRVFRTGNDADEENGFLRDDVRPSLQADLASDLLTTSDLGDLVELSYRVRAPRCRPITPKVGDVLSTQNAVVLVSQVVDATDRDQVLVRGSVIDGSLAFGDFRSAPIDSVITTFYTQDDQNYQLCWVRFDPEPVELPGVGIDPFATISLRFSEPIDPSTVGSLESMVLHTFDDDAIFGDDPHAGFQPGEESVGAFIGRLLGYTVEDDPSTPTIENGSGRIILGPVSVTADSRTFTIAPSSGITDGFNEGELDFNLALALRDRTDGVLDLAGNPLGFSDFVAGNEGQSEVITIDDFASMPTARYFALRMRSVDENGDGFAEYTGQFVPEPGIIRGRDLVRFSRQADPSANTFIGQRAAFLQAGVATPLNPAGAVLQTCYGYHHLGFGVTATGEYNLDVEGMAWAPFGGTVFDDVFDRYSIALAHSNRYPDDYIDPQSGYPDYDKSGFRKSGLFDDNILGNDGEEIVFDKEYVLKGSNTFTAESGNIYMPWPEFDSTYTWRDNDFSPNRTGGPRNNTFGVPVKVTGQPAIYAPGEWPSVVAPLLVRFRCYPRGDFFGANGFQVQIMMPSSNVPSFRTFSFGGNGGPLVVPDVPQSGTEPTGGTGADGSSQRSFGPELYWANIDFVVRVSRVFTHIFPLGGVVNDFGTQVREPVTLPEGTNVQISMRGYEQVDVSACGVDAATPLRDATSQFDGYGNFIGHPESTDRLVNPPVNGSDYCASVTDPSAWRNNISAIADEEKWEYFQLRITFVSNIEKDLEPYLDAYGFSWTVQ